MSARPSFDVVVDTNIIFTGGTGRYLASRRFKDAIRELGKKADITIHIPEMVFEEALFQKVSTVAKNFAAIMEARERIEKLVNTTVSVKHDIEILERRIKKQLREDLRASGFKLIKGNLPAARWREISLRAVRRKPPFNGDDQSAFRDSVICATMVEFAQTKKSRATVFLIGDKNARAYATQFEKPGSKIFVLPSTEGLAAVIEKLSSENSRLLKVVRDQAAKRFYDWGLETLFRTWDIHDKVIEHIGPEYRYRTGLSSPHRITAPSVLLSNMSLGEYPPIRESYKGTELLELVTDGECKFRSKLSYILHEDSGEASISGVTLTRREFDVTVSWSAQISGDSIADPKFGTISFGDEHKSDIFVSNLSSYLSSGSLLANHANPLLSNSSAIISGLNTLGALYPTNQISGLNTSAYAFPYAQNWHVADLGGAGTIPRI